METTSSRAEQWNINPHILVLYASPVNERRADLRSIAPAAAGGARAASTAEPDIALIRRMAAGDEEALRVLYAVYGRRMLAYALRLTGNPALAEEVLQDSLLAAWQGARSFRGEGRPIAWLLGIVHHQALNATRRKQFALVELDEALTVAAPTPAPDAHTEAQDRRRALAQGLQQLSPEHRAVLDLVFFQGLTLAEAAQVCRCPLGTIKSRLSYAKAYLAGHLTRAGVQAEDLP